MRFQWWLISPVVIGSCFMGGPSQAQELAKPQDQMQSAQVRGQVFGEPEYFLRKHLVDSPKLDYPQAAQEAKIQGKVVVFVWFDKDGSLVEAKTLVSPDESLSNAVVTALKVWRIKPYGQGPHLSEFRFVFSLKEGEAQVSDAPEAEQRTASEELKQEIRRRRKQTE